MSQPTTARRRQIVAMAAEKAEEQALERATMPESCPKMPGRGHAWEAGLDGPVCQRCGQQWELPW